MSIQDSKLQSNRTLQDFHPDILESHYDYHLHIPDDVRSFHFSHTWMKFYTVDKVVFSYSKNNMVYKSMLFQNNYCYSRNYKHYTYSY